MQPISLLTKGYISTLNKFYEFPFAISIDYGAKQIDVLVEDVDLLVETEQGILTIEAGQENIEIILDQPDVTVND